MLAKFKVWFSSVLTKFTTWVKPIFDKILAICKICLTLFRKKDFVYGFPLAVFALSAYFCKSLLLVGVLFVWFIVVAVNSNEED